VILFHLKQTKLKLEVLKFDFQRKKRKKSIQINLQLTGKISLELDFSSSLLLFTSSYTALSVTYIFRQVNINAIATV